VTCGRYLVSNYRRVICGVAALTPQCTDEIPLCSVCVDAWKARAPKIGTWTEFADRQRRVRELEFAAAAVREREAKSRAHCELLRSNIPRKLRAILAYQRRKVGP
jgi:hypothetical protein